MRVQDLTNEELAAVLRAICITGIAPSRCDRDCLTEAADRLERSRDVENAMLHTD